MYQLCMFIYLKNFGNTLQELSEDKGPGGQWRDRAIVLLLLFAYLGFLSFL